MAEQLDIIDEDGATAYRHRLTGFVGRVAHGGHCAGMCVTERPGVGTIARMLASTWLLTLPGAEFVTTDRGAGGWPRRLKWVVGYAVDGITPQWKPVNGLMLFDQGVGSTGTPLESHTGATSYQFIPKAMIPANLLAVGYVIRVRAHLRKAGSGGQGAFDIRIGTAGTSADGTLFNITVSGSATPAGTKVDTFGAVTTPTQFTRELAATSNVSVADVLTTTGANFDITQPMYITVGYSGANSADTFSLVNLAVYLEAV